MRFRHLLFSALCLPSIAAGQELPDPIPAGQESRDLETSAAQELTASGLAAEQELADRYSLCPPPPEVAPAPGIEPPAGATFISSETLRAEQQGLSTFAGGVVVRRGNQLVTGDIATYDRPTDRLIIDGLVNYRTPDTLIEGSRAEMVLGAESGVFHDGRFRILKGHGSGSAAQVEVINPELTQLYEATYSTCPPQDQDWRLDARRMALDEATNTGEAWDVKVSFQDVPFLYLPYLNFALEGRKTGLLVPALGTSEAEGFDFSIPWYWNIAPNRDATFTPRYIELRGTMLYSEFRYLTPNSEGQFNVDHLPDDSLFGDDRTFAAMTHTQRLSDRWRADALYNYVSDPFYFDDISNTQSATSQTHLERRFDLSYQGSGWSVLTRAQGYQTLSGSEPYQRLPQVLLRAKTPPSRGEPTYGLDAEVVNFVKATSTTAPTGIRVDMTPSVTLPLEGPAWFLTPRLALRYSEYQLEDAQDTVLRRSLPVASLDAGLFFERDLVVADTPLLQTLEPRLFYLHVPFEEQDQIPLFDTKAYDFTFSQLFRTNRFSGADRVGDADQLTTAVTTRFLNAESGRELGSASIGQIFYRRDREVTLEPSDTPEETNSSDVVAELTASPIETLDLSADIRYDPHERVRDRLNARVRYRPAPGKALSLSYRQLEPTLDQTDLAFYWPVARHWNVLGRWNYDLLTDKDLDTIVGVEYQDCCWALRVVRRNLLNTNTLELDRSILITLELKGLAHLGRRLDEEVERGILGY